MDTVDCSGSLQEYSYAIGSMHVTPSVTCCRYPAKSNNQTDLKTLWNQNQDVSN